jgi:cyclophilin family peptidyl-prolyl cis-trans isomerase
VGTAKRDRQKANRQSKLQAAVAAQEKAKKRRSLLRIGALVAATVAFFVLYWLFTRDDSPTATTPTTAPATAGDGTFAYGTGDCPPEGVSSRVARFDEAPALCIDPDRTYTATFETSAGTITALLDTDRTPGTTNNFVTLARYRYYDGTTLFRSNTDIGIVQGGGLSNTDSPGYTIPDEGSGFTYQPGDLVMARTGQPNSAGAQFFFAVDENTSLLDSQGTYVVFGRVVEGMDALEGILASHVDSGGPGEGAPDPTPVVRSVRIAES